MKPLAQWMVRLYPSRWRRRYGAELEALIEDEGASGRAVVDVLKEAIKMQLTWPEPKKLAWSIGAVAGLLWLTEWGGTAVLLLAGVLATLIALAIAADYAARKERRRAQGIVLRWSVCAAAYGATLVLTGLLSHEVPFKMGAPICEDDWCMSVESIAKTPEAAGVSYRLAIRISSLANRAVQSAKGASVYLTDDRNRQFPAVYDPSVIPFDVAVRPGESVSTALTFVVPADARGLFFAGRMDRISYGSFIIGIPDLLHRPRLKFRID